MAAPAMNVPYSFVVSDASSVNAAAASNGVTDTSAFASAVATVVASDTTTYSSVTAPSASDITSASPAASVSISGGTAAPTGGSSDNDSNLTTFIIIVAGIGAVVIIGLVIMTAVKAIQSVNMRIQSCLGIWQFLHEIAPNCLQSHWAAEETTIYQKNEWHNFLLWKTRRKKIPRPHGKIHKLLNKFGIIWCTSVHIIIFMIIDPFARSQK
jgi:hypothetical protein